MNDGRGAGRRPAVLLALVFLLAVGPWVKPMTAQPVSRLALSAALVEGRTVRVDRYRDVLGIDHIEREGHLYSDKAPGQPFAAAPLYGLARLAGADSAAEATFERNLTLWWVTFWSAAVPGALLVLLMVLALERDWSVRASLAGAGAIALGTLLLPFSSELYGHVMATALVFAAWTALRRTPLTAGAAALGGALVGAAVVVEYQLILAAVVLAVALLVRAPRRFPVFALAGAPFAAALLLYQRAAFGGALRTSYAQKDGAPAAIASWPKPAQSIEVLVGNRGIFVVTPIVLFAIVGLWRAWRTGSSAVRLDAVVGAAVFASYWMLQSGWGNPWGGEMPGPRYMITGLPFLAVGVAAFWGTRYRRVGVLLALWSIAASVLPTITLHLVADGQAAVVGSLHNISRFGVSPTIWTMAFGPAGWVVHLATVGWAAWALRRALAAIPNDAAPAAA